MNTLMFITRDAKI